jgi:hypothetical protein
MCARIGKMMAATCSKPPCDSGPLAPAASRPGTFDWAGQQISPAPPPAGRRREGQWSGTRGARSVKERSVGEAIGVGDYYLLANRLRRAKLQEIIDRFDTLDLRDFQKALQPAYAFTDSPFSPLEAEVAADINTALGRAAAAFRMNDRDRARTELGRGPGRSRAAAFHARRRARCRRRHAGAPPGTATMARSRAP